MEIITKKSRHKVKIKEFLTVSEARQVMVLKEPLSQQDKILEILIEEVDGEKDKKKIYAKLMAMNIKDYVEIVERALEIVDPKKK